MHIGIVEDDPDQLELLKLRLAESGHGADGFASVAAAIDGFARHRFDLLIVDWMLPDGTGAELLEWARQNLGWEIPILVLTARDDEATVVAALRAGADDYVVKPPKPMELLARVAALGRRSRANAVAVLRLGAFALDTQRQRLSMDGAEVILTQKEFDLSAYLFQNPGKLLSRAHLLDRIWGIHADVDTRTVDIHVSRLRKKLGLDGTRGWKLVPVYGVGYRFERADPKA
jgi:DNA-binding response OmpR family regulator